VAQAITSALGDHTAAMSESGTIDVAGTSLSISGTGTSDFTEGTAQMTMQLGGDVGGLTEKVIYLGGVVYINEGSLISRILPGKSWVSVDLSQVVKDSGSLGTGSSMTNNPVAALKLLAQQGNTATDLGPSTVNGVAVEGYSVTLSPANIHAALSSSHLPAWIQAAIATVKNEHEAYQVYVTSSGQLARLVNRFSATAAGHFTTATIATDYSHFGEPVSITAPNPAQVGSFENFLMMAQSLANSTST
jgi:hypothetical protein